MGKIGALAALAAALLVLGAGAALAAVTNVGTTVSLRFDPLEAGGGAFEGRLEARKDVRCSQGRRVDLFRDGAKVGSTKTEKYPDFSISLTSVPPGSYVAKVKKMRLPASLQAKPGAKNAIYCKAASSKPVVVP